jgi:hypothetical protein
MARFATIIRSTYVTVLTVGLVVAGAASFAAYEAKVVQVKAVVENAVTLDVSSVDFGQVIYPMVATTSPFTVSLSNDFASSTRLDGVTYVLKPKPKVKYPCGVPGYGYGTSTSACPDPNENPVPGDPWAEITVGDFTGYAWDYCESRMQLDASTTDATSYTVDLGNDYWKYCYLPMGSWLDLRRDAAETSASTSTFPNITTDLPGADVDVMGFHEPYTYQWDLSGTSSLATTSIASGKLSRLAADFYDRWSMSIAAPCFVGFCPATADLTGPYLSYTPGYYGVPLTSRLDPKTEHKVFGSDLWLEVTGFTYATTSTSTP